METGDPLLQYSGERWDADHWDPPGLQMQQILHTHDNKRYELYSAISYAPDTIYENHEQKHFIKSKRVGKRANIIYQQFTPYVVLYKKIRINNHR